MSIDHGLNGAFVRGAWEATVEPQTETVYAVRIVWGERESDYINHRPTPFTEADIASLRESAYRRQRQYSDRVLSVEQVSREVTISATDWALDMKETK